MFHEAPIEAAARGGGRTYRDMKPREGAAVFPYGLAGSLRDHRGMAEEAMTMAGHADGHARKLGSPGRRGDPQGLVSRGGPHGLVQSGCLADRVRQAGQKPASTPSLSRKMLTVTAIADYYRGAWIAKKKGGAGCVS